MSETLLAVIIGGAIASITPVATIYFEQKRWRKEKKIELLTRKKEKLEILYKETQDKLAESMVKNNYSTDVLTDFSAIFPSKVSDAFHKMIKEKDKTHESYRKHFFFINMTMKESLADIDNEIMNQLN